MADIRHKVRRSDSIPQDIAQEAILILRYLIFKAGNEVTIPLRVKDIDDYLETELGHHPVLCKRNNKDSSGIITSMTLSLRRKEDAENE